MMVGLVKTCKKVGSGGGIEVGQASVSSRLEQVTGEPPTVSGLQAVHPGTSIYVCRNALRSIQAAFASK